MYQSYCQSYNPAYFNGIKVALCADPIHGAEIERFSQIAQAGVTEHGCDLGVGYDGDGDRIGIIDNKGGIVWATV